MYADMHIYIYIYIHTVYIQYNITMHIFFVIHIWHTGSICLDIDRYLFKSLGVPARFHHTGTKHWNGPVTSGSFFCFRCFRAKKTQVHNIGILRSTRRSLGMLRPASTGRGWLPVPQPSSQVSRSTFGVSFPCFRSKIWAFKMIWINPFSLILNTPQKPLV